MSSEKTADAKPVDTAKSQTPTPVTKAPEPAPLQLDKKLIAEIAAAVAIALRAEGAAQVPALDMDALGAAIADGIGKTTRRKVTFGEYAQRGHSSFHPKSLAETPKLTRVCYQNGVVINHSTAYDREIELLNALTHPGRYLDRLVEVVFRENGSEVEIDVRYPNATADQQLMLKSHCKDFIDMLEQIVKIQVEERAEKDAQDEDRAERRRSFGVSKGTRAAEAAARS